MHVIQPELSPIDDAVSYYMNGRLGWVLGAGLIFAGAGSLSVAYALHLRFGSSVSRWGLALLAIWGIGATIGGIFPPDPRGHWNEPPSLSGVIHGSAAMAALLAFPPAALLLSKGDRRLKTLARLSLLALAVFFVCLAPVFRNHAPYGLGLAERIMLALYAAWIGRTGIRVARA
jgi:hypothetical membrane protein